MKKGKWINLNTKDIQYGYWGYHWPSDTFRINLDSEDPITGIPRTIITSNDSPEWGEYKLIKEE